MFSHSLEALHGVTHDYAVVVEMYRLSHEKHQQMNDKAKADLIPTVTVSSGEKFVTPAGVHAIKDGIKTAKETAPRLKKPDFL